MTDPDGIEKRLIDIEYRIGQLESKAFPQWVVYAVAVLLIGLATSNAVLLDRTSEMPPTDYEALTLERFNSVGRRVDDLANQFIRFEKAFEKAFSGVERALVDHLRETRGALEP